MSKEVDIKKIIEERIREAEEEYQKWLNVELLKHSFEINKPNRKGMFKDI